MYALYATWLGRKVWGRSYIVVLGIPLGVSLQVVPCRKAFHGTSDALHVSNQCNDERNQKFHRVCQLWIEHPLPMSIHRHQIEGRKDLELLNKLSFKSIHAIVFISPFPQD